MPKIKSTLRLNSSGVTLTELMVVIVLLAILFVASNLIFKDVLANSRDARRKADLSNIQKGLEIYRNESTGYPATLTFGGKLTSPAGTDYLSQIPQDPLGSPHPQYVYVPSPVGCTTACTDYGLYGKLEKPAVGVPTYDIGGVTYDYKTPPPPPVGSATPTSSDRPLDTPTPGAGGTPTPTPEVGGPGLGYYRIFVTSTQYNGDLKTAGSNVGLGAATDGIDGANKICQSRAAAGGIAGNWKAWISETGGVNASTNLTNHYTIPVKLYINPNFQPASNWTQLTSGSLSSGINGDEFKHWMPGPYNYVWTNTANNGTAIGSNCNGWTDGTTGYYGYMGQGGNLSGWTNLNSNQSCDKTAFLYCFEQ